MKARTPPSAKLSKKQIYLIEKMSHELAEEALKRGQKNLMRRWFKLMCVALWIQHKPSSCCYPRDRQTFHPGRKRRNFLGTC